MRHTILILFVGMAVVALVAGRNGAQAAAAQSQPGSSDAAGLSLMTGKVVATMDAGGYTYVQVDDGAKKIWAAAPQFTVAVGDQVVVPNGMPMRDFQSKTLGRTFELVYFVPNVDVVRGATAKDQAASAHGGAAHGGAGNGVPGHSTVGSAAAVDLSNIQKAPGGQTVAELYANKTALVGKDVAVRGRVVKFTRAVMGKNWMHVHDGTGSAGSNDLTVSTSAAAAVGNLVLVRGKLGADRDLGAGYHYDIIIEDAAVAVE